MQFYEWESKPKILGGIHQDTMNRTVVGKPANMAYQDLKNTLLAPLEHMKHKQSTWLAVINQRSKDWLTEIRDRGGINGSVPDWEAVTDAAWVLAETQIFTIGINDQLMHCTFIH